MAATIHGGSLGRWFEQLCRLQHPQLRAVASSGGTKLRPRVLPAQGGVYAFWWTGEPQLLTSEACNRDLELTGPGGRPVHLLIDDDWLGMSTELPIPLYVGKNSASISRRVGQHLLLGQERVLPMGGGARKAKRPTTSCQLRAGVEHMFPDESDTRSLVLENVGLSFVTLDGDDHAANRFYLEDLAIGLMRPPLNVDIER
jgi:hypothetical protein